MHREDLVICILEHWNIWIGPRMFRVKDVSYDEVDKPLAETGMDVGREVLDPWVNPLLIYKLGKLVNHVRFIDLCRYSVRK